MEQTNTDTSWTPFYYESNQYFGWIESPTDWEKVKTAYSQRGGILTTDELLDKSHVAPGAPHIKYGLRSECDGDKTLREFFTEQGMAP